MSWRGILVTGGITAVAASTALTATVAAGSSDLCAEVPAVTIHRNDLGFHARYPSRTHPGARGHAKVNLSTRKASGVMCQVNRDRTAVLLTIGQRVLATSHHAVMFGVQGNILKTPLRVKRTNDPSCKVGTRGTLTVFASYNNIHKDSVQLSFPAACRRHGVRYTGSAVTTNVPPN